MLAHYINLKAATARRARLEAQVQALPPGQWVLQRFEAIDADSDECRLAQGRISEREKGCFLSHRALLTQMLHSGVEIPFMVWEDDVLVGPSAHGAVERFLAQAAPSTWDILYTDLIVPDLGSMLELLTKSRKLRPRQEVEVLDLRGRSFAGASAYLVNPRSLQKVVAALDSVAALNEPVDLLLRRFIHEGALSARALFPFVTTVSDASLQSQIQPNADTGTDLAWTLFRRLMWSECQVESLYPMCNQLSSLHPDPESSVMGVITAALISPYFKPK
jgi:GR25 family glycosyltransferase involved in LPS biosynthesis